MTNLLKCVAFFKSYQSSGPAGFAGLLFSINDRRAGILNPKSALLAEDCHIFWLTITYSLQIITNYDNKCSIQFKTHAPKQADACCPEGATEPLSFPTSISPKLGITTSRAPRPSHPSPISQRGEPSFAWSYEHRRWWPMYNAWRKRHMGHYREPSGAGAIHK